MSGDRVETDGSLADSAGFARRSGDLSRTLRVLIVDDNEHDRAEAKAALLNGSNRRYVFIETSSAEEGLRLCAEEPLPDCMLLDLGLPDVADLEMLARLPRDEDDLPWVPVVVLTGAVGRGLNRVALRAGAQDYGGKSWLHPETLTQAVENSIERLRMTRALRAQQHLAAATRIKAVQLENENVQMHEANRLKSQFLANMSHELRTPLTAIIGFAELLQMGAVGPDSPKYQIFLGHIGTSGRHLLRLINDVLDLSKVESGKLEFFPEALNLPLLVSEVIEILHTEILRKHVLVVAEIEPDLCDLWLDNIRLKQVLYNYLSNAIKFTPEGGRITVRACALGARHFKLEVEDTGVGIAERDVARLFTAYQQLDAGHTKQYQGSGLGLALTRRLVEAQHGSVGAHSTPGVGSVFHVVLNRLAGTDEARDSQAAGLLVPAGDQHVLVIEDVRDHMTQLVPALTEAGFLVDAAGTGELAVQRARSRAYDAITLDLLLPDQRGLQALQEIREGGLSRESPVVRMTLPMPAGTGASFAIADVLCKPIRIDEVVSAMSRFRLPGTSPTNVMVVDDDRVALELMQATLKTIGIDAVVLQDARQALREIDQHRPDAVILDLVMPGFDGFAFLDALRRLPAWRDTPVFVWTSLLLTDAEYASLAQSARAILSKGGGSLESTLDALRRWRPALATLPEAARP